MTTPFQRDELEDVAADLRKRVRVLEAITPPPPPGPPSSGVDYGFTYISWTPVFNPGAGTNGPSGYTATGIGVASHVSPSSALVFVHSTVEIICDAGFTGGLATIDWLPTFHPSYPRVGAYFLFGFRQDNLGYGTIFDASAGTRQDVWVTEANSFPAFNNLFRIETDTGVSVSRVVPFTWAPGDTMEITLDYWSFGP